MAGLRRGQITALSLAAATVFVTRACIAAFAVLVATAAGLERFGRTEVALKAAFTLVIAWLWKNKHHKLYT